MIMAKNGIDHGFGQNSNPSRKRKRPESLPDSRDSEWPKGKAHAQRM